LVRRAARAGDRVRLDARLRRAPHLGDEPITDTRHADEYMYGDGFTWRRARYTVKGWRDLRSNRCDRND